MRLRDRDCGNRFCITARLFFFVAVSLMAPSLIEAVTVSGRVTKCGAAVGYTVKAFVSAKIGVVDDLDPGLRTPGGPICIKADSFQLRGTTTTDANGDYSINVDVSQPPFTCHYEFLGITVQVFEPGSSTAVATSPLRSPMNFSLSPNYS